MRAVNERGLKGRPPYREARALVDDGSRTFSVRVPMRVRSRLVELCKIRGQSLGECIAELVEGVR